MKYKVTKEFLPGVIVGQECEPEVYSNEDIYFLKVLVRKSDVTLEIPEAYVKQHPEIFKPIVEPEELKENETEFVIPCRNHLSEAPLIICKKCSSYVQWGNFCSNCGRKRKI